MIRYTILIVLLSVSTMLKADVTYLQLQNMTDANEGLKGKFSQLKYLTELEVNLPSSGNFEYQKGKKIIWRTIEPIANEMIMTPNSIVNNQQNEEIVRLEGSDNPAVAVMSEIFFSVLTAQWENLSKYFQLNGTITANSWQAKLSPLDDNVKKAVSLVELEGDNLLRRIVLHEKSGDKTTIVFEYSQ